MKNSAYLIVKVVRNVLLDRLMAVGLTCIFITIESSSQYHKKPMVAWLLPGVSYQDSSHVKLLLQYGLNPQQQITALYGQAFVKVGKHIVINPGYLFLHFDQATPVVNEHGIMNAVIFSYRMGKFNIEDRNLFWHRFRTHANNFHFYRNRLRITGPVVIPSFSARLYAFDEVFYLFNQSRWTRNRLAIGCSINVSRWLNTEIFYAKEHDAFNGKTNFLFVITTYQLRRTSKHSHPLLKN